MADEARTSRAARLFDVRRVIGGLGLLMLLWLRLSPPEAPADAPEPDNRGD